MRVLTLSILLFSSTVCFSQQPNILYIMADDLGYADLSCYGRKDYKTPNLDKLSSEGLKFMQAYSAASLCTPTRVGLMTGRYPARHQVGLREPLAMTKKDSAIGLSPEQPTLPALLKNAGYETALIGKWHLGFQPQFGPNANGFDYFFGIHTGGVDYQNYRGEKGGHDLYENDKPSYSKGYLTDLLREKTVSFLKKKHEKPFFLSLNFNAPHWPWQGPTEKPYPDTMRLSAGGTPEIFSKMMESLDNAIGEILATLDQAGLSNNTIVIFTSDNGGDRFSYMGHLSGGKAKLKEGGIRVPAIVRWPGKIKTGVTEQPVITFDWTATMLSLAGAKPHELFPLDGVDLLSFMTGDRRTFDRTFYWRSFQRSKEKAIRDGNWKWLEDEKGEYLFDLSNDQGEKNDLKENQPEKLKELKRKYAEWENGVLKPVPLGG